MALMRCPSCRNEVDEKAAGCSKCGYDFIRNPKCERVNPRKKGGGVVASTASSDSQTIWTVRITVILMVAIVFFMLRGCSTSGERAENESVTKDDKVASYTYAQAIIEDYLRVPNSAKFPWSSSDYAIVRTGDRVKVESWVESENAFGAIIRNDFVVIYEFESGEEYYVAKYVQLGDNILLDE